MSIDLKQNLDVIDYFGALVVWVIFFSILFIVSVTCINWCCIQKHDDITVLEEVSECFQPLSFVTRHPGAFMRCLLMWGYNHRVHMRMGPHRPSVVARNVRHPPKSDNGF
ncbi:hypothetical protein ANCDUO_22445 [Ancylostoma duodenale]|uniref:Uncharacterized protein n=1 Tax=Ancylostoma duodenale TaxID=51022 RepID=A0A0C2FL62_9BILA|nr:hypothetical protein ANCDUO_22445 [Ancylostoma duodenale]